MKANNNYEILKILQRLERRKIDSYEAFLIILQLISPKNVPFENVKIGDFIIFDKVYSQSKRYTAGKKYKVNKVSLNKRVVHDCFFLGEIKDLVPEFSITDDHGKQRWIPKSGLPNYRLRLISSQTI